ncbi:PREDICTED: SAP-like protein BP-73 [Fragaria vesca subsp. vesca]|uniref:SAP-like protein BP-73 n=1 Tax=Fragaria vesca subsp. vesca TaxID=101020 RepID=UPI0002C3653D|nr:PREDICTED: SAP-like protein BP-73 [Fragaria vesca subsp. vesca]
MGGIVYQYHSVLHFPTFSSFSKQPKYGKPIFSLKDIADVALPFERKGQKLIVSCNGSDEGNRRGQSSRRSTGSGRTAKNDEAKKPRGGRKSKSSNQEEIISLFRRIQSSISKEVESVDTKKIKSDASEEKPPSAESILRVLQGGSTKQREVKQDRRKVDTQEQRIQANPSVTDFKLTRPPSKFVKRSPIPSSAHMSRPPGEVLETKNGASVTTAVTELELERVEEMKLPELKELAKSRGMRGYSKLKKKELVELLKS